MVEYSTFSVAGADTFYRLTSEGATGDAGNRLQRGNGMAFSTIEQDHDVRGKYYHSNHEMHNVTALSLWTSILPNFTELLQSDWYQTARFAVDVSDIKIKIIYNKF